MMKRLPILAITTILFLALCVAFFIKDIAIPYKIGYPILVLSLGLLLIRNPKSLYIAIALFLSFIGDTAGAMHQFLYQILFFALAHISYIIFFLSSKRKLNLSIIPAIIAPLLLLAFLTFSIVPSVNDATERIGVISYGIIISTMLFSVLSFDGKYKWGYIIAAILFVFSDSVIAWNKFVSPVSNSKYIIMITYYAAQYLFFFFTYKRCITATKEVQ